MASKIKFNLILILFLLVESLSAQNVSLMDLCGWRPVVISDQVPVDLTSSRSAVIISMEAMEQDNKTRPNWEKLANKIHADLRKMYIDPVCYVHQDDLMAGPEIRRAFVTEFQQRGVKNLIFFEKKYVGLDETHNVKIVKFNGQNDLTAENEKVWAQIESAYDLITLRLGRQIIRQNIKRTNFLIPEGPNILKDLPVFTGVHLGSYPGLIRRANLAVVIPEKYKIYAGLSANDQEILRQENLQIDRKISDIESIMTLYPYKYQLVNYGNDETLYKQGFQFALFPFQSTGVTIKNMLNYKISGNETDYISMVPKDSSGVSLKTIPVEQIVYKYYIKQTIAHDVYVGKEWDSDFTWESALRNFIINLGRALK
ncbi:MAG: hypothetical protein KI791_00845 [Cyclobacteriaceae bacterium]|nr:hypothetical protein [Cyclobacteriaceae bacterium SS2]